MALRAADTYRRQYHGSYAELHPRAHRHRSDAAGLRALAVGGIRLGYKATVKDLALELVEKAELSIMGSGQGAKKKKQVFAALRAKCPAAIRWAITDEVMDAVIEHAFDVMTAALGKKS